MPRPFVENYLPALLAQASQLIASEFRVITRRHGFSDAEWRILASLEGAAPLSIGQLARVAVGKQPAVTRQLDRLEERGLVQRVPHESDRRMTLVRITPEGSKTVARLIALAREHEARALEPFGQARAEALRETLTQLIRLRLHATGESAPDEDVV